MSSLGRVAKTKNGATKKLKSGDGLKYIRAVIDSNILTENIGQSLLTNLESSGINFVTNGTTKGFIRWERRREQQLVQNNENVELSNKFTDEDFILKILSARELNEEIEQESIITTMQRIKTSYPGKKITILVYGIKEFCRKSKNGGRYTFETKLTELQVLHNFNSRLIETSADLNITVQQFSKSIGDIPFKKQQSELSDDQNFFVINDNRDCVSVKGKTGLSSLWQHHLTKLPLVALETAEAIIAEYPMPRVLLEAYGNNPDGPDLLENIPVRRAGGPLSSVRRIGPELSKKLHALYTKNDPNYIL
ncbi:Crossover junction endonuclease EME1 [Pseudolycoriella hygida]|uniref:Crossover junction endonuclease EME1 n=1 Tax=Pseudolycoriella hygida TaxID=35572 RepID=A0A9Q0MWL7_9DIPT|nr:Crossover junction endonuclease EME1 [Pseudolycoriella hygida]